MELGEASLDQVVAVEEAAYNEGPCPREPTRKAGKHRHRYSCFLLLLQRSCRDTHPLLGQGSGVWPRCRHCHSLVRPGQDPRTQAQE